MHRMIVAVGCAGLVAVPAVDGGASAAAAAARSVRGSAVTWVGAVGRPPAMQPSPFDAAHPPKARVTVSGGAIDASFEGYTGATHDSPSARTSCSIHYRFVKREGVWSLYRQVGAARYAGNGYVANAPCEMRLGGALKTTPAGSKLRADFGIWGDPATYWRGYLKRA
jgi:hypothetical protein